MKDVREIDPEKLIAELANRLKDKIQQPEWSKYVKTGPSRERPPEQDDWWYVRAASILRRIALDGPVGVRRLRTYYGSRKRRGPRPAKFMKGSGKIIRTILQQLESIGLIQQVKEGKRKGRILTPTGQKFINEAIKAVLKGEKT